MASNLPNLTETSFQTKLRENHAIADEKYSELYLKGVEYVIFHWKSYLDDCIDEIPNNAQNLNDFLETDYFNEVNVNNIITLFNMTDDCKEVFKCIMRKLKYEIHQFFGALLYLKINTKKLWNFLTHLKFTSEIAIDHKETVLLLVKDDNLIIEDKYKLSCYFCLEENLNELAKLLNEEFINQMCSSPKEYLHLLSLFYHCSKNDDESFNETIYSFKDDDDEYDGKPLMLWAIGKGNKVAVEYIFEKFVKKKCENELNKFVRVALHHKFSNIVCYLLSKIPDEKQLNRIYLNENFILLSVLASDFRLRNLSIRLTEDILKHIPRMSMNKTIKTLIQCWILNESEREKYKNYFKAFEVTFDKKLNDNLLKSSNLIVLKAMLEVKDVHIFFNVGSISDVKELSFNNIKIIGKQLILDNKSQIFDALIQAAYSYKDKEIKEFKYDFFVHTNHNICSKLLENFRFHELDNFFLVYCKPDRRRFFKERLLTAGDRSTLTKVMASAIKSGKSVVDCGNETLRWCFNENEVEMKVCKKTLFDLNVKKYYIPSKERFLTVVSEISENKEYDIKKFLDWAYPNSTKKFKKSILKAATILEEKSKLKYSRTNA